METLSLDFNRVDAQGRVRIGPEARKRLMPTLFRLHNRDRVLVVDDDGASCEGMIEEGAVLTSGTGTWLEGAVVRLDMATWRDGPTTTDTAT